MTTEHLDAIGIGWDVRGWQGNAQAVAVVGWQSRTQQLHWLGVSPLFRLSSRVAPDLDALLRPALQDEMALMQALACPRLALGIDAPLAFPRALGATFDRLGNNATLALSMLPRLGGLQLVPRLAPHAERAVLEVYPALAKVAGKASPARAEIAASLPADVVAGTDRYDAALCALMALQYAAGGAVTSLPDLVSVPPDVPLDEGWVYHFARP